MKATLIKTGILTSLLCLALTSSAMAEYYWEQETRLEQPKRYMLQEPAKAGSAKTSPKDAKFLPNLAAPTTAPAGAPSSSNANPQAPPKAEAATAKAAEPAKDNKGDEIEQLVEEKLFKYVQDAFEKRDQVEFERLSQFYLESFPYSERIAEIQAFQAQFFYFKPLSVDLMPQSLVAMPFPAAKNLDELRAYFQTIRARGATSVQMEVAQLNGYRSYLFADAKKLEGYYFKTRRGLLADDLLKKVVDLAHEEELKVFASLSLRHHPGLTKQPIYMMDDSWNLLGQETETTAKLDLFHVAGKSFLFSLIEDLAQYEIDGVVIKDDFTYSRNEGFSEEARKSFLLDTGMPINFQELFRSHKSANGEFGLLTTREFWALVDWRTAELRQSLWEVMEKMRDTKPKWQIGIEVSPQMMLEEERSRKNFATTGQYIAGLPVDFFILKRKPMGKSAKATDQEMFQAAQMLQQGEIGGGKTTAKVIVQTPLDPETMNLINLNRTLEAQNEWNKELSGLGWSWGPVDRNRGFDFTQFSVNPEFLIQGEQEEEEEEMEEADLGPAPKATTVGSARTSAASLPAQ